MHQGREGPDLRLATGEGLGESGEEVGGEREEGFWGCGCCHGGGRWLHYSVCAYHVYDEYMSLIN